MNYNLPEVGQQSLADITCLDTYLVNFDYFKKLYHLEFMSLQNLINEIPSPNCWNNDAILVLATFSIQYISLHELFKYRKIFLIWILKFYIRSKLSTIKNEFCRIYFTLFILLRLHRKLLLNLKMIFLFCFVLFYGPSTHFRSFRARSVIKASENGLWSIVSVSDHCNFIYFVRLQLV